MEKINLTIRGHELRGDVLDDSAMLFFSLAYTDSAKKLAEQGKEEEALQTFVSEYEDRIANAKDQETEAIAINTEIAHRIRRTIRYNWEMRRMVCWELLKIFRDTVPKDLVYWNNENDWGLRLEMAELIEVTIRIIATAFTQVQEKIDKEKPTVQAPSRPPALLPPNQSRNQKRNKRSYGEV
jgi:hypothetical protein